MILSTIVLEDRQSLPCFTNSCPCIDFKKKKKKSCSCCALTGKNRNKGSCSRVQFEKWWSYKKKKEAKGANKRETREWWHKRFSSIRWQRCSSRCYLAKRDPMPSILFFGSHTSQFCLPPFCLFQHYHLAGIARKMNAYQRFFSSLLGQGIFDICIELWSNSFGYFN